MASTSDAATHSPKDVRRTSNRTSLQASLHKKKITPHCRPQNWPLRALHILSQDFVSALKPRALRFCERVNLIRENELGKLPVLN